MRRHADRQRHGALGATGLAGFDGALDGSGAVVSDLATLKADLLAQLYSPVRWVESMVRLSEQGVTDLVECGPGKVLSGLNKRCVKGINTHNLDTPDAFAAARAALA